MTLQVLEDSLYIHDQIGEYQDRGEMLEQFGYLDFFLQTYDKAMPTHEEGCRGRPQSIKIPYREHSVHQNRCRILRGEQVEVIPNFPGKWFANRDNPQDRPLYCASMLALLKPWRCLADLKSSSETFVDAFEHFVMKSSSRVHDIVENIQYFHDCSESARRRREAAEDLYMEGDSQRFESNLEDDVDEENLVPQSSVEAVVDESQVQYALQHPFSTREALYAQTAMNVAFDKGIFTEDIPPSTFHKPLPQTTAEEIAQCAHLRRTMSLMDTQDSATIPEAQTTDMSRGSVTAFNDAQHESPTVLSIESQVSKDGWEAESDDALRMNDEQKLALDIIQAQLHRHLHDEPVTPLLMVICGEGGTGKSALLEEVTQMYARAGCSSHLAKTAMSGVAASIIGGSTLHSWAGLPSRTPHSENWVHSPSREIRARRERNMLNTWLLGVDEVSMMTAEQLAMLSEVREAALCYITL